MTVKIYPKAGLDFSGEILTISTKKIPKITLTMEYQYFEYWNEDQDGRVFSEGSDETLWIRSITKEDGSVISFPKYNDYPEFSVVLNGTILSDNRKIWIEEAPLENCQDMLFYLIDPGLIFKITHDGYDYEFSVKEVELVPSGYDEIWRIDFVKNELGI